MVTITVKRSGGSLGGPVTVNYATSNGTATAGSDYAAASGTLTFGPGEAAKSFTVHVTSDLAQEGNEPFQLTLSSASGGASLGSPAGATVTITDDDAAPAGPGTGSGAPPASAAIPTASDRTAPKLKLAAKKVQRALKAKRLVLSARCNERCKLTVVAKVRIGKKKVVLGRAKTTAPSGKKVKIKSSSRRRRWPSCARP